MKTQKNTGKGKGYYMKSMSKAKKSIIMQACATSRWAKASQKERKALGLMLAEARKVKKEVSTII